MGLETADRLQAGACRAIIEIALARHGRLTRASVALGYQRSHFAKHLRTAKHLNLYRLVAGLGVEPVTFARYAHAFDDEPLLDQFGAEALDLATRRPTLLRRAAPVLCRFLDGKLGGSQPLADLEELDALLYAEPESLAEIADCATALAQTAVSVGYAARAIGIAAAALRFLGQAKESQVCVWIAIRLAAQSKDASLLPVLIRYAVYLLSDSADFDVAVEFVGIACRRCRKLQDLDGYGRSLFIRGLMLKRKGDTDTAQGALESALQFLRAESTIYTFGAHQNLADLALLRGELEVAERHAERAARVAVSRHATIRLAWLRGRLAYRSDHLTAACRHFERTVSGLESSPLDVALAGLEYVRVLLRLRLDEWARQQLAAMKAQILALEEDSPLAAAALWEVLRLEGAGRSMLLPTVVEAIAVLARVTENRASRAPACAAG